MKLSGSYKNFKVKLSNCLYCSNVIGEPCFPITALPLRPGKEHNLNHKESILSISSIDTFRLFFSSIEKYTISKKCLLLLSK